MSFLNVPIQPYYISVKQGTVNRKCVIVFLKFGLILHCVKSDFVFMSADIRDAEGIPNYAAIVVRLDNPRLTSVIAEFTETVQLLIRSQSSI